MVRFIRAVWVLVILAAVLALGASSVAANDKVTLCHATNSLTNPFVQIEVSVNGLNGHRVGESFHVNAKTGLQDFLLSDTDLSTCDEVPDTDLCADLTQEEAQAILEETLPEDPYGLDEDGDGIACEIEEPPSPTPTPTVAPTPTPEVPVATATPEPQAVAPELPNTATAADQGEKNVLFPLLTALLIGGIVFVAWMRLGNARRRG